MIPDIKILSPLNKFWDSIRPSSPAAPGLYHYERQNEFGRSRIHLRIDPDGSGLLLVNANRVIHLNPTAAFMSKLILDDVTPKKIIQAVQSRYQVSTSQVYNDYTQLFGQIDELVKPDGMCPIHTLDLDILPPFSTMPSAPYRMDLALTYRCNNDCSHCYNARSRQFPEIDTDTWKSILDKTWEIGIPHVVFTGGEPTLRNDLPELITYAEKNGQITGLNTNARRLRDRKFIDALVDAGLDHVQITIESHIPEIHDYMVKAPGALKQSLEGLRNVLDTPLYVMTNTTLLQENSPHLEGTLHFLASLGVPTIGLNALIFSGHGATVGTGLDESELVSLLDVARKLTDNYNQKLIWYTPTQYCNFDPMQLQLGIKGCTAALYNMCVEPNGDVLPCQSFYQPVGNILKDDWDQIWKHPLSLTLRERRELPAKCSGCVLVQECGGGCPLQFLNS